MAAATPQRTRGRGGQTPAMGGRACGARRPRRQRRRWGRRSAATRRRGASPCPAASAVIQAGHSTNLETNRARRKVLWAITTLTRQLSKSTVRCRATGARRSRRAGVWCDGGGPLLLLRDCWPMRTCGASCAPGRVPRKSHQKSVSGLRSGQVREACGPPTWLNGQRARFVFSRSRSCLPRGVWDTYFLGRPGEWHFARTEVRIAQVGWPRWPRSTRVVVWLGQPKECSTSDGVVTLAA